MSGGWGGQEEEEEEDILGGWWGDNLGGGLGMGITQGSLCLRHCAVLGRPYEQMGQAPAAASAAPGSRNKNGQRRTRPAGKDTVAGAQRAGRRRASRGPGQPRHGRAFARARWAYDAEPHCQVGGMLAARM